MSRDERSGSTRASPSVNFERSDGTRASPSVNFERSGASPNGHFECSGGARASPGSYFIGASPSSHFECSGSTGSSLENDANTEFSIPRKNESPEMPQGSPRVRADF